MNLIERPEARRLGKKRYFTGRPCIHYHIAERIVSSGHCAACKVYHRRGRRACDPEGERAKDRTRRQRRASLTHHLKSRTTRIQIGVNMKGRRRTHPIRDP
jgi:hypothetical protein